MSRFSSKRRVLLTTTAALALSAALAACGKKELAFQGSDITGTQLGRDLDMIDDCG
jgi:protein SCO1/2